MEKSACLMLAASLHTAIDVGSIIRDEDLKDDGIIKDSHITIVYDKDMKLYRMNMLSDVEESLGSDEFNVFIEFLKDSYKFKITDVFYLDSFNNDTNGSSYLVLRLKEDNSLYNTLSKIHYYIRNKYNIPSDFSEYNPHVTLAELKLGAADKYLDSSILDKVLNDSKIGFEDLVLSLSNDKQGYDHWNITTYHALKRFFRETSVD